MAFEFKLPDIGEGVVEGEVVQWLVREGEAIAEDQPMVEVMTDKATVEIPSPRAGRVAKVLWKVGDKVPVGAVMIVIEEAGDQAGGKSGKAAAPPAVPAAAKATSAQSKAAGGSAAARVSATPTVTVRQVRSQAAPINAPVNGGKVLATPAVRQHARNTGVDISGVSGSGPGGRVTREDVDRSVHGAVGAATPAAQPKKAGATPARAQDERIPFVGLRRKIAENMARSTRTAAHFTYVEECDVTDLVRLRERSKANFADRGVRLSYLPFIIKAVVAGLRKYPILNATLDEEKNQIVLRKTFHIGVAAASDKGLIVPVVRDADQKSIFEVAREVQALGERTKTGKLQPADLGGSTFTISSLGEMGGVLATPIINFPEVAILGVHKIRKRPVVVDNQIVIRDIMNLSISLDHRIVDGYEGALFLAHVVQILQDPLSLVELI
jgi:pyruvate/2-oxoglutarate dehydrogenase complex dihydrolipoamide acyltransferase (E2) component